MCVIHMNKNKIKWTLLYAVLKYKQLLNHNFFLKFCIFVITFQFNTVVSVVLDKWRMWPILIHDNTSLLNQGNIVLDGSGKTIHLQCTASVNSHDTSLAVLFEYFNDWGFSYLFRLAKALHLICGKAND